MLATLLRTRRFLPLFVTQALGALNDNLFKNALVVLVLFRLSQAGPVLVALAGGVFILPYILFSAVAGQLVDRMDKLVLVRTTKLGEVVLMALAAGGFLSGSLTVLMAVLLGLGVQATFFSPLKYGLLPEHLRTEELVAGNGLIEAGTFLAILVGTIAGSAFILFAHGTAVVAGAGIAVALAGAGAAWQVPCAPAASPNLQPSWRLARETAALLRQAHEVRSVWLSILGISWFWVMGATLLAAFPTIARDTLRADSHVVTSLLTVFSVGIGVGSIACARLLRGEVTPRLVPFAALAISVFTCDFAQASHAAGALPNVGAVLAASSGWRILLDLLLIAFFGGLYSVPL